MSDKTPPFVTSPCFQLGLLSIPLLNKSGKTKGYGLADTQISISKLQKIVERGDIEVSFDVNYTNDAAYSSDYTVGSGDGSADSTDQVTFSASISGTITYAATFKNPKYGYGLTLWAVGGRVQPLNFTPSKEKLKTPLPKGEETFERHTAQGSSDQDFHGTYKVEVVPSVTLQINVAKTNPDGGLKVGVFCLVSASLKVTDYFSNLPIIYGFDANAILCAYTGSLEEWTYYAEIIKSTREQSGASHYEKVPGDGVPFVDLNLSSTAYNWNVPVTEAMAGGPAPHTTFTYSGGVRLTLSNMAIKRK